MCRSQNEGGQGFRDLKKFNQAMLPWRILRNPESLLAIILRGKYFKDGNFLRAKLVKNPSLAWRSIFWGEKLFKERYRWNVENGQRIIIDEDPWIEGNDFYKLVLFKDSLKGRDAM